MDHRALQSRLMAAALCGALAAAAPGNAAEAAEPLKVCADPNNMPFSRADGAGFENKLAELIGARLGRPVSYEWRAQRRGFLRRGLKPGECDLVAGLPEGVHGALTTRPYYRASYVFVTRPRERAVSSLDDPVLKKLRIGVQMIGDDGMNTPPALELAQRGIVDNVRGFSVYGDYSKPAPPSAIVEAVARGDIDVAAVWGPTAGYFARQASPPLVVTPIDLKGTRLPLAFDIAVAVRKGDEKLAAEVQSALDAEKPAIDRLLAEFHVPPPAGGDAAQATSQR